MLRLPWVLALASCFGAGPASAQASAVVVVVESADPHVDAARIRARLSAELGAPVLSLFDEGAASARGSAGT